MYKKLVCSDDFENQIDHLLMIMYFYDENYQVLNYEAMLFINFNLIMYGFFFPIDIQLNLFGVSFTFMSSIYE